MFLRDGRLVVITGEEPANGELAVFAVSAILELKDKPEPLTGAPEVDLENGVTAGTVNISAAEWQKVLRWRERGDYITLTLVGQGATRRFKWGFVRRDTVERHYLSQDNLFWLNAWIEATTEQYQQQVAQAVPKKKKKRPAPGGKKAGRKGRKKKSRWEGDWWEGI